MLAVLGCGNYSVNVVKKAMKYVDKYQKLHRVKKLHQSTSPSSLKCSLYPNVNTENTGVVCILRRFRYAKLTPECRVCIEKEDMSTNFSVLIFHPTRDCMYSIFVPPPSLRHPASQVSVIHAVLSFHYSL